MKVARFSTGGDPRFGIVDGDDLVVLKGDPLFSGFDTTDERVPLDDVKLLAPVIPRSKIVCVGLNYPEHKEEMDLDRPDTPLIFLKPNTAIIGPGEFIQIPPVEGRIVHEGELAIVIGKIAKQVKAEDYAEYVFGYTIANDVSARDQMFADGQWARAKGYDTFCPIGPIIETELDWSELEIQTHVDHEPRRHGNTRDMIHKIPQIIEFVSDVWTLLPGDLILTGTPAGLGGFVDGQVVSITIDGIGTLSNPARNRDKPAPDVAAPAAEPEEAIVAQEASAAEDEAPLPETETSEPEFDGVAVAQDSPEPATDDVSEGKEPEGAASDVAESVQDDTDSFGAEQDDEDEQGEDSGSTDDDEQGEDAPSDDDGGEQEHEHGHDHDDDHDHDHHHDHDHEHSENTER